MTSTPDSLPFEPLFKTGNQPEYVRTWNAKLLCNCATAKSSGTELRDIFSLVELRASIW